MSRRYGAPVEVRRRDEDPAEFLWRGRFYVVRSVLAHWVETGAWWRAPAGGPTVDGSSALALDGAVATGEREVWRVEASAGRSAGSGIYDLSFDWDAPADRSWTLVRTMD
jgi:uncharacterized protein DUF6504